VVATGWAGGPAGAGLTEAFGVGRAFLGDARLGDARRTGAFFAGFFLTGVVFLRVAALVSWIFLRFAWVLALAFFLVAEAAEKSWRRLDGHNQLPKVVLGVKFTDGIEIRSQAQAAAA
jgi:hypothetical protein